MTPVNLSEAISTIATISHIHILSYLYKQELSILQGRKINGVNSSRKRKMRFSAVKQKSATEEMKPMLNEKEVK